ncbi:F-box associated domain-containing protein [Caenorhabditis elegans]|uniref:F-box associated domain-containing protein n=1 Tax=Caenorhabditis elegans TaxID=6239 RepID=G1K0Y9_CAEEL|nr:F-box associated domain-containing protein [Caenorhabditis elegans]CCC42179.1 F-box associated domain-containing protein [Caenorhabditis elegans]|eukprot:NP_001256851.1 Uncharacterized protein CELE_F55C9.15 [Caenorhabditis elegans]
MLSSHCQRLIVAAGLTDLLSVNCAHLTAFRNLCSKQANIFLTHWINGGFYALESAFVMIHRNRVDEILKGIMHKDTCADDLDNLPRIFLTGAHSARNIYRCDGRRAIVLIGHMFLRMHVLK